MAFCSDCGESIQDGVKFCSGCGKALSGESKQEQRTEKRSVKETKFIEVNPDKVQETIDKWQCFGWELLGAPQEIKTQDRQFYAGQSYDKTTKYYETEEGEHYVKITFQRDKSIPNYEELVSLEKTYNEAQEHEKPNNMARWEYSSPDDFPVFLLILTVLGLILGVAVTPFFAVIGVVFLIPTIIKIAKRQNQIAINNEKNVIHKNYQNGEYLELLKEYEAVVKKGEEAISRAKTLLG